jgi:uncharacterized protein YkwD
MFLSRVFTTIRVAYRADPPMRELECVPMSFLPARLPARLTAGLTVGLAASVAAVVVVLASLAPLAPAHAERDPRPASSPDVSPRKSFASFELRVLDRINEVRAQAGLRKIARLDSCVDKMAEKWAGRLASRGVLEHRNQNQVIRRCGQRWAGENLVKGTRLTPYGAVDAWLASPGHREIMMKPRARLAGVAFTRDGRGEYVGVLNVTDPG